MSKKIKKRIKRLDAYQLAVDQLAHELSFMQEKNMLNLKKSSCTKGKNIILNSHLCYN